MRAVLMNEHRVYVRIMELWGQHTLPLYPTRSEPVNGDAVRNERPPKDVESGLAVSERRSNQKSDICNNRALRKLGSWNMWETGRSKQIAWA